MAMNDWIGEDVLGRFRAHYPGHQITVMDYDFAQATGIVLVTGRDAFEEPLHRCPECGSEVQGAVYEVAGDWGGWTGMRTRFGYACPACGWMGFAEDLPRVRRWEARTWSREEVLEVARRPPARLPANSDEAERRQARWALEAIERHLAAVGSAPQGARNQTLARAAAAIGAILAKTGESVMTAQEAEARLLDEALACGLKRDEALSTIRRQLRWGMSRG